MSTRKAQKSVEKIASWEDAVTHTKARIKARHPYPQPSKLLALWQKAEE
jgi:hypothetical protein